MKIAEGCNKHCTYCIIPKIRGEYRSVPIEELVAQAKELVDSGVKELILVAQETTLYGVDLYGKKSIGRLFQDPMRGSAPGMSIEENMALAAGHGGWLSSVSRKDKELFRVKNTNIFTIQWITSPLKLPDCLPFWVEKEKITPIQKITATIEINFSKSILIFIYPHNPIIL